MRDMPHELDSTARGRDVACPSRAGTRRSLEQHLPGLVVGVYLVGSASSGDHGPGRSDVDAVAVVRRPLGGPEADALRAVHDALAPEAVGTAYDTTYVPAAGSPCPPPGAVTPFSLDGALHLGEPAFAVNPVTWVELKEATDASGPPTSRSASRTCEDLAGVDDAQPATRTGHLGSAGPRGASSCGGPISRRRPTVVVWHVLGAPRLHATLATGGCVDLARTGSGRLGDSARPAT